VKRKGTFDLALSMTGYGRGKAAGNEYTITIDLKTINHRFLEIYCRVLKVYSFLEDQFRREINGVISRGKVEITVTIERITTEAIQIQLNNELAAAYFAAAGQLKQELSIKGELDITSLLSLPNILNITQPAEDQVELTQLAITAVREALQSLLEMRRQEGNGLARDIQNKLGTLTVMKAEIAEFAPELLAGYQDKLSRRITELTGGIEIDPARLAVEVALLADKSDISEELVRLDSHLQQFHSYLDSDEPVGRRLDFLTQELNREINTIGSKSGDLRISQLVIGFKSELEKIREQIQNIE
jgi:uncharacterized protein (TIGR00255 family)